MQSLKPRLIVALVFVALALPLSAQEATRPVEIHGFGIFHRGSPDGCAERQELLAGRVFSGRAGVPTERATEADVTAFVKANTNALDT
ncbi:MAG: hypothetical protein ABI625_13515 [bacterium]